MLRNVLSIMYYGKFRRIFRGILRRIFRYHKGNSKKILTGPLRGNHFLGLQAHQLGIYERAVEDVLVTYLHYGSVFYDIGANIGYFSILGAQLCGNDGIVYCFEPLPSNLEIMESNISANNFTNIKIITKAVSDIDGNMEFNVADGTKASLIGNLNGQRMFVEVTNLNSFTESNVRPNLIKIDVEGAEKDVIHGASKLLTHFPAPIFLVEIHDEENDQAVREVFDSNGFHLTEIEPTNNRRSSRYPYHILAEKYD